MAAPPVKDAVFFASAQEWEDWLAANNASAREVWIKLAKKGSGIPSLGYPDITEVGLCYGWISAQRLPLDDTYYLQRYVPRRPQSNWSKLNRETAERLIAEGRMRPAGFAEIEAAKADGRWDAARD